METVTSFGAFLSAVFEQWILLGTGSFFVFILGIAERYYSRQIHFRLYGYLIAALFFYASFQAWKIEHDKQPAQPSASVLTRKMRDDLALRVKASDKAFIERINKLNPTIAFTCDSIARQFADDLAQLMQSSGVYAERLAICKSQIENTTTGLSIVASDRESITDDAKQLLKLLKDSQIPISPNPQKVPELNDPNFPLWFVYIGK